MSDFQEFKREKVLVIVEEGKVTSIIATDNLEVVLIDKDEVEFTDFYEADALDEAVDHEIMDTIIDELINEFHEEIHTRGKEEDEEEDLFEPQ